MSSLELEAIFSPAAVDVMIADGESIVIFQDHVLRLSTWLKRHPGGSLAILHMVGRDATEEITAYHSEATLRTMKTFRIGRKPIGPWPNRTPPIRRGALDAHGLVTSDSHNPEEPHIQVSANAPTSRSLTVHVTDNHGWSSSLVSTSPPELPAGVSTFTALRVKGCPAYSSSNVTSSTCAFNKVESSRYPPTVTKVLTSPDEYINWAIQQAKDKDVSEYPSVDVSVQHAITKKYMKLLQRVQDEGLYNCRYIEYGKETIRYSTLFIVFLCTLHQGWFIVSAVALGLFWHQIMFTAHDAGHRAITSVFEIDTLIGLFIADFCCGLSMGWWKSSHNIHHLVTNQPEHDPDIQNVPLFSTCPSFSKSLRSTYYDGLIFVWGRIAEVMVPFQKYTYYPIMSIARFNLYLLSWHHVLSNKSTSLGSSKAYWVRPTEVIFMACYWFLFGYTLLWRSIPTWTDRIAFVLISHIVTMPLHVQITLSHWGMSTSNLGEAESFPQRQLRTTMDVSCPAWLDFIHGGLQFQATHHLFPRVPRHNLRRTQALVKDFCADTGIPHLTLGFFDGNKRVLSRLDEISEQARILLNCQKYMAKTGENIHC